MRKINFVHNTRAKRTKLPVHECVQVAVEKIGGQVLFFFFFSLVSCNKEVLYRYIEVTFGISKALVLQFYGTDDISYPLRRLYYVKESRTNKIKLK